MYTEMENMSFLFREDNKKILEKSKLSKTEQIELLAIISSLEDIEDIQKYMYSDNIFSKLITKKEKEKIEKQIELIEDFNKNTYKYINSDFSELAEGG